MSLLLLALTMCTSPVWAFCGFYVSGADASLYNDATQVVLVREGKRTVLSMQNNYEGPALDFAMVVPVPTVIQKGDVKTLPNDIFEKIDTLSAPRLVEYWEEDPCDLKSIDTGGMGSTGFGLSRPQPSGSARGHSGVTVEAEFQVEEYDVVILSAKDSAGLETWLRREKYNIPSGAEAMLRPYVASGTKFFVARVDLDRVSYVEGRAVLSPLQVSYESEDFTLPVRLGLLNSKGEQDIIVTILARNQRYEVANYPNRTIPTNLVVLDSVREDFGDFYESLFTQTRASSGNAVITEYAWRAGQCDPCPGPALDLRDLNKLGGAVVAMGSPEDVVLTRLHQRYGAETLGEDLVFRAAPPIVGGRGIPSSDGELAERESERSSHNNFQGRYVILHRWEGEVSCEDPVRGRWGRTRGRGPTLGSVSSRLRSAPTGSVDLASQVTVAVPSIGVISKVKEKPVQPSPMPLDQAAPAKESSGFCGAAPASGGLVVMVLAALASMRRRLR